MRRSTVVSLNSLRVLEFLRNNHTLLLLTAFYIIGMVVGTVSLNSSERAQKMAESALESYIKVRSGESFVHIMLNSASSSYLMLLLVFIGGASMLGVIVVPLLIAYRGFWYGILSALLYSTYSLKGIAFNAVLIIPSSVLFLICLLMSARESVGFSLVIARLTLPKTAPASLYVDFKNYCGRYLIICVVSVLPAILDALMSGSFMDYFSF